MYIIERFGVAHINMDSHKVVELSAIELST